ncbi:hydroxypyruvate isomerase [Falsochrobactrum shanghaiense]|uniref:Hydroxypyruvate isomerase n=1 Tax=Falsochrobactrum shanghaiense TaxID=2201899 RepID=A0A316JAV2_9HYPH|nr:TIM barrel protein [Falsochrobactrum shanghaiense]PWL18408.1 hydroxypyruvate isomerase [Falsochrobactrum shanghaiense]
MAGFKYSAHIGYLFTEMPLAERIAAAARHGFAAVEYPSPYHVPAQEVADWLRAANVAYTQFGLHAGNAERGEKGIAIFPERREEFRQSVASGLDYAKTIGVRMVHAMAGIVPTGDRKPHHWETYIENLAYAAQQAARHGITIIVEPMSAGAVPDYFIETPEKAVKAIEEAGQSNIALLLDIYHTVSMGLDPDEQIRKYAPSIAHVHIADFPGRHEPGTGTIDFASIRQTLDEVGYKGWLGCEYSPEGQTQAGLGWLKEAISSASTHAVF